MISDNERARFLAMDDQDRSQNVCMFLAGVIDSPTRSESEKELAREIGSMIAPEGIWHSRIELKFSL